MGTFPEASMNPEQNSLGTIQGNDFGGHAPLVGAHVYVLQPSVHTAAGTNAGSYGESYNAYGYQATSLLSATYSNNGANYPTTIQNSSDPGIPTSWYYLKTDLTGAFNITGDYTCTVGLPVYLYLYGGMPQYPSANNTYSINKVVWSGTSSPYTVTLTITTNTAQNLENAYTGEFFTINGGFTSAGGTPLNGSDQVVIAGSGATGLTTTQFSFSYGGSLPSGVTVGTSYTESGSNQVTFLPTFNPAVVNLAVLGNCPSTGNFSTGPSALSYVFVNEVSTVAAAYAFRPFTISTASSNGDPDGLSGGNNAIYIGTSSTNIAGLQNAPLVAAQLYDVTGSNVSTTYAGEGHIARPMTTAGNGIIPQANIDTLGNILAACVDSNNGATTVGTSGSYNGSTGAYSGISSQCSTLFSNATLTGIPVAGGGQQPFDTATAAINIARHPAGPPYSYSSTGSSSFMSALFNLPTGNVPFAPYLTTMPNDFTLGIDYTAANNPGPDTYPLTTGAESVAVDRIGNAWFTTQPNKGTGAGYMFEMNPAGVVNSSVTQYNSSYIYGYVTIDSGQSAWAGSANSTNAITYVHSTNGSTLSDYVGQVPGTYTYSAGATNATLLANYTYAAVASSSGNVYFGSNKTAGGSSDYIESFLGAATTPSVLGVLSGILSGLSTDGQGISHGAIDASGDAFFNYNAASGHGTPYVTRIALGTGLTASGFPVSNATSGCTSMLDPEQMTVVRSGDIIQPDYYNGAGTTNTATSSVYYITSAGVCTQLSGATLKAGLSSPFGSATDGLDYVYITNRGAGSISVLDTSGGTAASTVAVSPSNGYEPQLQSGSTLNAELSDPLNIAIDPSGNAWVTDYGNDSIVELVGIAVPATTPLANAAIPISYTQGSIGYKP